MCIYNYTHTYTVYINIHGKIACTHSLRTYARHVYASVTYRRARNDILEIAPDHQALSHPAVSVSSF